MIFSASQQEPQPRDGQFEDWVHTHAAILHHTVHAFASGADREDLMQELLLAVWKAVPAFRGESQVSTFLYRVTHNAAMTWRRRERTHSRRLEAFRLQSPEAGAGGEIPSATGDPDGTAARLERLYAEIRRLPALDRSLVLLSLDGMSHRDMAAIHGLSESNVGARLSRARQKLTHNLKERKTL
ncbi:MAG: ylaC [Verrucomicrobiales bacterium]|nr:ylaC [Verrucomicrobiales bacterium]